MKQSYSYDKVFYCNYQTDESVETPCPISPTQLPNLLKRIAEEKENFISFVDDQGTTIQFYINAKDQITIDIPEPKKNGSYTKDINESDMNDIANNLQTPFAHYKRTLKLSFTT